MQSRFDSRLATRFASPVSLRSRLRLRTYPSSSIHPATIMGWAADTFGPELLVKTADGAITKVDTDAHVAGKKLLALYFSAHVRSGMRRNQLLWPRKVEVAHAHELDVDRARLHWKMSGREDIAPHPPFARPVVAPCPCSGAVLAVSSPRCSALRTRTSPTRMRSRCAGRGWLKPPVAAPACDLVIRVVCVIVVDCASHLGRACLAHEDL